MPSLSKMRRKLQGYRASGQIVRNTDLRSASAFRSEWEDCKIATCQMDAADFSGAKITDSWLAENDMRLISLQGATLYGVTLERCNLEQANFRGAVLRGVRFIECRMAYSSFDGATVSGVSFAACNLHGANLCMVESSGLEFNECNLWGAQVPLGCTFFNALFDRKSAQRFVAMAARLFGETETHEKLRQIAGDQYRVVERLMREEKDDGVQDEDADAQAETEAQEQEAILSGP